MMGRPPLYCVNPGKAAGDPKWAAIQSTTCDASPRTPRTIRAFDTTCLRVLMATAGALLAETVLSRIFKRPTPGEICRGRQCASGLYRLTMTKPTGSGSRPAIPPNSSTGRSVWCLEPFSLTCKRPCVGVNHALFIYHCELVRIVDCSGANQLRHQGSFSGEASARNENGAITPTHDAGVNKRAFAAYLRHVEGENRSKAMKKFRPVSAGEEQPAAAVETIGWLRRFGGLVAMDERVLRANRG